MDQKKKENERSSRNLNTEVQSLNEGMYSYVFTNINGRLLVTSIKLFQKNTACNQESDQIEITRS